MIPICLRKVHLLWVYAVEREKGMEEKGLSLSRLESFILHVVLLCGLSLSDMKFPTFVLYSTRLMRLLFLVCANASALSVSLFLCMEKRYIDSCACVGMHNGIYVYSQAHMRDVLSSI